MKHQNKIFRLEGKLQHYQWGGFTFLPELLGIPNADGKPFAEYWLGAHSQAPATVGGQDDLAQIIASSPEILGEKVRADFGRLPYLLKILDVKDMLSIQVHPTRAMAREGFAAENLAGIPLTATNRNYKDDNHKPELMAALSPFWLLHGFRPQASMNHVLASVPELAFLAADFDGGNYEALYRKVMEMPDDEVYQHLLPLLQRITPLYEAGQLDKSDPSFWAARAAITFNSPGSIDKGIFSVYLLNLVFLQPGEAIFQDAGILHAYLEGQNVEIMANSDNVLRGGLTPKHIDVPELMKHVRFQPVEPEISSGTPLNNFETVFHTPAADFELSAITLPSGATYPITSQTAEILLVLQGKVLVTETSKQIPQSPQQESSIHSLYVVKGESLLPVGGAAGSLLATSGAVLYRATVPGSNT